MWIVTELDGDLGELGGTEPGGEECTEVIPPGFGPVVFEDGHGGGDFSFICA